MKNSNLRKRGWRRRVCRATIAFRSSRVRHRQPCGLPKKCSTTWSYHAAERAAEFVAGLPREGDGEWKVWPSVDAKGPNLYRVARRVNAVSVYDSPVEGRARDVSDALNEIERHGPDAAGCP